MEVWIQPGVRMRLYLNDKLSYYIYCDDFEWQERQFLNAFLRPGDIFVDIGASMGLYSAVAGRRVGPEGRVYAFEPCSRTFLRLLSNVALNGLPNVSCHRVALSDQAGRLTMTASVEGFDAWNSFGRPTAGTAFEEEVVDCMRWDDFAREHNLIGRVAMMKIDVEGWEMHVLSGGATSFSRDDAPILQVEFTDQAAQSAGSSCAKLYHALEQLGYRMFVYDPGSGKLIWDALRESYPYLNLIAVKEPERAVARLEEAQGRRRWDAANRGVLELVTQGSRPGRSAFRRFLRSLHDWGSHVPALARAVRVADHLHLRVVARERYEGSGGRDYLDQYAAAILSKTHGRVLDLGCGHGYVTYEIACRAAVDQVVAIDKIDAFHCVHPKIIYTTQDLVADPHLPAGFDVVVATEFIEHISEAAFLILLPVIRDALRDGGLFIGSTPPNPTAADTFSGSPYHRREYQPSVLRAHLGRYFTDVRVEQHGEAFMTWIARRPAW